METPKVFESEYRFCLILWEHEPFVGYFFFLNITNLLKK